MKRVIFSLLVALFATTTINAQVREIFPPFKLNSSFSVIKQEMELATAWNFMLEKAGDFADEKLCLYYNWDRKISMVLGFINGKLSSVSLESSESDNNRIEAKLIAELNVPKASEWTKASALGNQYAKFYKDSKTGEIWEFYCGPISCDIKIMTETAMAREKASYSPSRK